MTLNLYKIEAMKFETTINNLKNMLPATDFIITGSYVLAKYGLMPWDKVFDLDIILIKPEISAPSTTKLKTTVLPIPEVEDPNEKVDNKFGKVAKAQTSSLLQAIFKFEDTKIDIFIEDNFSEPTLLIDGIKHTTVSHILKTKKSYGRMKDWMQCREMSRVFYIEEEFRSAINKDWRSMLKSDY
jgi:hypothetical protein